MAIWLDIQQSISDMLIDSMPRGIILVKIYMVLLLNHVNSFPYDGLIWFMFREAFKGNIYVRNYN